jgi:hypothetical protein
VLLDIDRQLPEQSRARLLLALNGEVSGAENSDDFYRAAAARPRASRRWIGGKAGIKLGACVSVDVTPGRKPHAISFQ